MTERSNSYDISAIQRFIPAVLDKFELDGEEVPTFGGVVARDAHFVGYPAAEFILAAAEEMYLDELAAPAKESTKPTTKRRKNKN